jgi:hypothetical protein
MGSATLTDEGKVSLSGSSELYVDADWLPRRAGEVPGVTVQDGALHLSWASTPLPLDGRDPVDALADALAACAEDAVAAVAGVAGAVEVRGRGATAELVRGLLGARSATERPSAIIDCTGDPDVFSAALQQVDDLGTVVLAGLPQDEPVALDTYADIHLRGLRLVGGPKPFAGASAPAAAARALLRSSLVDVPAPGPLGAGSWFRIRPADA